MYGSKGGKARKGLPIQLTGLCYVERLGIRPDACPVLGDTQFLSIAKK